MLKAKDIKKLRSQLEHGDLQTIAERVGFSHVYVSNVLNYKKKDVYNTRVIEAAISLRDEKKKQKEAEEKRLAEAINAND